MRLYNLDQEIGEKTNLANQHPEIFAKLRALADKINTKIGGHAPSARRPAGTVENPQMLYPSDAANPKERKAKRAGKKQAE